MPPRKPPNPTAASLLGFLHDGPMTGWDLLQVAQAAIGNFWSITQSQVYRELAAMATAGLVEAGERGPRDRQPYAITDAGRSAFSAWLEREPGPELIRHPLLLTVMFGRHLAPERLAASLERHRAMHAERLADYEADEAAALASGADEPYALATLRYGIAYERGALGWFDALPATLRVPEAAAERPGGAA